MSIISWGHEPFCPYSELPINCPRNNFKLPGETMSSSDIVDEFAYSHQTWAVEFLEGWQVFFYQTTLFRLFVFFRRWFKKAVTETLLRTDQNLPGWVFPFCQKVDFHIQCILPTSHFKPGTEIKFPLLFTEELDFDLYPYLLVGDDGLGTVTTSWKNDPMWFFLLQNLRLDVCLWCLE